MGVGIDRIEIGGHIDFRDAVEISNAAVNDEAAFVRGCHDVVEEIVADDGSINFFAEQINDQDIAGLEHIDGHLIGRGGRPRCLAFFSATLSTSPRIGMNCTVKTRPTIVLPGCRTMNPSAY